MKVCSVCQRCYEDSVLSCSEENHASFTEARAGGCEIIQNYRLEVLLESSPKGDIYRAVNAILKKPYLIKIISPELFDEAAKKQFLRETQALAAIIHPNLVRVFESGALSDGSLYVVTEYVEAQTLRECLANVGKPSEVTAVTITRQTAEGLEAIHAAGALHRNIKPENIILTSDLENRFLVKLQNIDFGGIGQKQVLASPEQYLSDLRYFSPEQCEAKAADVLTDVYGLGVVLYESLAGKVPFDAPYGDAIIIKQISEQPPEFKINSFDIRMLLTHTLSDALQKQTRTRLKSANAFARRLRHIEQLATHSSTPPPAVAYPAAMSKPVVAFTTPVKIENPVAVAAYTIAENLPLPKIEIPIEEVPVLVETPTIVEDLPFVIAKPKVEETPALFETQTVVEKTPPLVETQTIVDDLPVAVKNETVIEETPVLLETQAVVEEAPVLVEAPAIIEETPVVFTSEAAVEPAQIVIENDPVIEELPPAIENQIAVEELSLAEEIPPVVEELPPLIEESAEDVPPVIEAQAEAENQVEIETPPVIEEMTPVAVETQVVFDAPVETQAAIEAPVKVEAQAIVEDLAPVEAEPVAIIETPVEIEAESAVETPVGIEVEAVAEKAKSFDPVFIDYSTTKLPPIEAVVGNPSTNDDTEIETVRFFKPKAEKNTDIHKTSEPAIVHWEQPDDVPTITQALKVQDIEASDAAFAPQSALTDDIEDEIIDAGEIDAPPAVVRGYEYRRNNTEEGEFFAYRDSGFSFNLPDNRKILTGLGVAALAIVAVGGTFLNRHIQSAPDTVQNAVKTAPNAKTLPKPVEQPVKVSDVEKLSEVEKPAPAKPEILNAGNTEEPELPNYQPRETDSKTVAITTTQNRNKKRAVKESSENRDDDLQTKTVSGAVRDKKGEIKPPVKNQSSTKKIEVFSRPRIVKTP